MKNEEKDKSEKQNNENPDPKEETYLIEGVGTVTAVGELNIEKLIKRLLKSKYITGK